MELDKPTEQIAFLKDHFGLDVPKNIDNLSALAAIMASDKASDVHLETPFEAAVHETREEHGWSFFEQESKIKSTHEKDEQILSKRSFDTDPPTPIQQKIFAIHVSDFTGVIPVRTEKIEMRVKARLGQPVYEQGTYVTLEQWRQTYSSIVSTVTEADGTFSNLRNIELIAAKSRLDIVERLQTTILEKLQLST